MGKTENMCDPAHPANWDLTTNHKEQLLINSVPVVDIAQQYGTPLYILNEERLARCARRFLNTVIKYYPADFSIHYPCKCNSVPAVLNILKKCGFHVEVMTEFELDLSVQLGFSGQQIIVNGPCKTRSFLEKCLENKVRLIIIDSLDELSNLNDICQEKDKSVDILLRINPDITPHGVNAGSSTGSRKICAFGLDLLTDEPLVALQRIKNLIHIKFSGYHFHIGTGIRNPEDYTRTIKRLKPLFKKTIDLGYKIKILDVGGGIASRTTREFTNLELLLYQGLNRLPKFKRPAANNHYDAFIKEITSAVLASFANDQLPELIFEPGRCIVSQNQILILQVHYIKNRPRAEKWLITDGGLGTITLPTYYEYHEIFLCNDVYRHKKERVSIIGPCCFAADTVYRNKLMPCVLPGEYLAVMDTGAYFNALESSFGFSRPAIVASSKYNCRLVRHRETFEEMSSRDHYQ
jgi:diaminopimelate decarboxylase